MEFHKPVMACGDPDWCKYVPIPECDEMVDFLILIYGDVIVLDEI